MPTPSFNHQPRIARDPLSAALFANHHSPPEVDIDHHAIRLQGLPPKTQHAVQSHGDSTLDMPEWSEKEVVILHWRLLQELDKLDDPETPLAEKIDTLRWIFTSPQKDAQPFSFSNCVRVVGTSPLSPTPYFGKVDVEAVRDLIRHQAKRWFRETLLRYPKWVRDQILDYPDWVDQCLDKNPQWLNEQVRKLTKSPQKDLFS